MSCNICIFNGDMSRGGGTERITQLLAEALCGESTFRITVLSLNNAAGKSFFPLPEQVEHRTLPGSGLLRKNWQLWRFLRKNRIDLLINVDIMLGIFSFLGVLLSPRTKLISWEMFNLRNDIGSRHTRTVRKLALLLSRAYVCLTRRDMEAFRKEMPFTGNVTYIYNPCVLPAEKVPYDGSSKTIVTAGHFFYTKGFDLAVAAARIVFARHPDWRWEFYGDGAEQEKIRRMIHEQHLEKNVFLCGRTNDLQAVYRRSALYVMTSRSEGFGLVLTEAKASSLPTIAFDVDFGPGEIIEDGKSGYLIPPFNVGLMAARICELIEDPDRRSLFSEHASDNLAVFSPAGFADRWKDLCREVLQ